MIIIMEHAKVDHYAAVKVGLIGFYQTAKQYKQTQETFMEKGKAVFKNEKMKVYDKIAKEMNNERKQITSQCGPLYSKLNNKRVNVNMMP